jgi:NAD(P)-dependent dehydrogenase (short-subunit alcohol dehydrogenase family)
MNLNVRANLLPSQQIGRLSVIPNGYDRFINLRGCASPPGAAPMIAYHTSKGAVVNFTRALAPNGASTTGRGRRLHRAV